jgi:hypothetical protein
VAHFVPQYTRWRHGGWYFVNIRYPSGACGCVSQNYTDAKWRIVCDPREPGPTYPTRDAAACAEHELADVAGHRTHTCLEEKN